MRFSKTLAKAYGIPEDYAILLEATWHRLPPPTQDELRPVPYYDHRNKLPEGVAEFMVICTARRAINDGVKLQEVVDRIKNLEMSPNQQIMKQVNEMLQQDFEFKHVASSEKKLLLNLMGKAGLQILVHAAIYQKKIVEHEHQGIFPRKLPEIIEQVNLVNQRGKK